MHYWLWSVPPDALTDFIRAETFALYRQGRKALQEVRPGDRIFVYVPGSRTLAALVEVSGEAFEDSTSLVLGKHLPHRVRVRNLTVLPREAWVPYDGFAPHLSVLEQYPDEPTAERQFRRVAQRVLHPLPAVDGKVLEFLVAARAGENPDALMQMVEAVRETRQRPEPAPEVVAEPLAEYEGWNRASALERLIAHIEARGFVYAPWQIAAFVTALRTRPFVLLAGVTGVGKTRLPLLVAEATGACASVLPVRPDWTDPSETLGYRGLDGRFLPGGVLRKARASGEDPAHYHFLVLDEMNLARPEHYLAEVLSRMELRAPAASGGLESPPLVSEVLAPEDAVWQAVRMGPNLGLVGTVNIDESAHAFSRKVLDRAFTLELDAAGLERWKPEPGAKAATISADATPWPLPAWQPLALRLSALRDLTPEARVAVDRAVAAVAEADSILAPAGLGVGYRTRDEVALFVLHAMETPDAFRTREGDAVDVLDLALLLKVLPRIEGAGIAVRSSVLRLLAWASGDNLIGGERAAQVRLEEWQQAGRPTVLPSARFPRSAGRLTRIVEGIVSDGVASFWA